MIRTRVGYGGGSTETPDYGNMGDHTETVQIDYDPREVSYAQLLTLFWNSHRPTQRPWKRQYMNAVFYHDERQRKQALDSKAAVEKRMGRTVHTAILPLNDFTRAEDYHQKYLLGRRSALARELKRIYPIHKDFVDSTVVARINGYVGGHGNPEQLTGELNGMGLSPEAEKTLVELVQTKRGLF